VICLSDGDTRKTYAVTRDDAAVGVLVMKDLVRALVRSAPAEEDAA